METGASVSVAPNPRKASAPMCAANLLIFYIMCKTAINLKYTH